MDKIKVLQFPIRNNMGGDTHYILNNWNHINKNKFLFDYITFSPKIDFESEIVLQGSKVYHVSCLAEDNQEQFTKEINAILSQGYDAIHLHTLFWKSMLVEQLATINNIPKIIVHSHCADVIGKSNKERQEALLLHEKRKMEFNTSMATDFCACSWLAADWLFGPQIPRDKIKIMHNAIDVNQFQFNNNIRESYRKALRIEDKFVIGHAGRMAYQKNHEFLINMFSEISKSIENAVLLLLGDGTLKDSIKAQVHELGLEDKVIFLGRRDDMAELYQVIDVFCLPSRFEGLPVVLIEAQAAGLKCLTSTSVTKEAKITDNLEFLPFDIDLWSSKIVEYSHGYNRMSMNDEITHAGYNIHDQIKNLEMLYSE